MRDRPPIRPRWRWAFWGAGLALALGMFLVIPAFSNARARGEMTRLLSSARQLRLGIAAMDDQTASGEYAELPADRKARSFREYLDPLVKKNYVTSEDVKKMRWLEDFALVNVSRSDPKDTAFLVSRWLANPALPHEKCFVVFTLGGSGGIYRRAEDATNPNALKLPNRQPQILPQE